MTRYRLALATVAVLIVAAVLFTVVSSPPPAATASSTGGQVQPVSERAAAPDFTGIDGWLNSPPLTLADLKGKVVLIDFWTFSCVNCVRTIPHLQVLYDDYKNDGFVDRRSPLAGVRLREGTGQRRGCGQAPRDHLAGRDRQRDGHMERIPEPVLARRIPARPAGPVAYTSFGEGDYTQTDAAVAQLLGVTTAALPSSTPVPDNTTPELYAGSEAGAASSPTTRSTARWGTPATIPIPGPPQSTGRYSR